MLVVALMISIGGHWGMLQVVAWAKMLQTYSAEKGLVTGLKETFDGEHPCAMCEQLHAAQSESKGKQDSPTPVEKSSIAAKWLGAMETSEVVRLPDPAMLGASGVSAYRSQESQWQGQPMVPPPRRVIAG